MDGRQNGEVDRKDIRAVRNLASTVTNGCSVPTRFLESDWEQKVTLELFSMKCMV